MFKKYINSIINDYLNKPEMIHTQSRSYPIDPRDDIDYEEYETVRFTLTPAIGGRILIVTRRDRHKDREVQTYVIPSGEDVGERVSKILNLELLK